MRLLVGLGNPGAKYDATRHNAGFWATDELVRQLQLGKPKKAHQGLLWEYRSDGEKMLVFQPQTFMNRVGLAIREVQDYYQIEPQDTAIVADDVYVAPGSARIRQGGGDGGHNGWKSVLAHSSGPEDIWRVKIGVGVYDQKPETRNHQPPLDEYVLQPLPTGERKAVDRLIDTVVPNLIEWLHAGVLSQETVHTHK